MSTTDRREPVTTALELLETAYRQALSIARRQPDSTWIDAASSIGLAQAQLLTAPGVVATDPVSSSPPTGTCIQLLEAAERALEEIPPGQGPVSLALVRSYLTEAIVETAGREP